MLANGAALVTVACCSRSRPACGPRYDRNRRTAVSELGAEFRSGGGGRLGLKAPLGPGPADEQRGRAP